MNKPHALVIFGPPGAGKGTQASMLARYPHVHHLSSGALSRNLEKGSELYQRFEEFKTANTNGAYFPDEAARDLLAHEIERNGYGIESMLVLDGIPRTEGQVGFVDEVVHVRAVIHLYASDADALIERMRKRDARPYDTNIELALGRIADYRAKTEPVIEAYRSLDTPILDVGALTGSPSDIREGIVRWLASSELMTWFRSDYKSI